MLLLQNAVLDAAIEVLAKYQSEFQLKAVYLDLSPSGDIQVSIAPAVGTPGAIISYGRVDRFTKRLARTLSSRQAVAQPT